MAGATVIAQMASFPETVTSADDAMLSLVAESRRLRCSMVLAAPGKGESTTDRVYSGLCLVAENGEILAQSEKADSLAVSEIDVEHLENLRLASGAFPGDGDYSGIVFGKAAEENAGTELGALYADLDKICREAGELWCPEAEKRLFAYAGIDA